MSDVSRTGVSAPVPSVSPISLCGSWEMRTASPAWNAGEPVAPGTEPPRERPEAWKAGRLMVVSAVVGAAVVGLLWWAVG